MNSSSISSSLGIGCRYFTVILLITLLSMHMRQVSSFFGTNKTDIEHELKLSRK